MDRQGAKQPAEGLSRDGGGPGAESRAILSDHDLFRGLSSAELDRILMLSRIEVFRPRQTIFLKGSAGRGLLAVLQGRVQIRALGPDGRELILNVIERGEVFGEIALLDGRERSADAVAMTRCRLLVIDRRDFVPFLRANPDTTLNLMTILCDRLRRTTEQVEDLMFLNLPSRLAKTLLAQVRDRREPAPGRIVIDLSQRMLANFIGFSRESVNKQLAQWQREGVVALAEGRIEILDAATLERCADGLRADPR